MFGGPFLDLPMEAIDCVKRYVLNTEHRRKEALVLAQQIREFDQRLQTADGFSLDDIRREAPETLRGRLELAYDLNNHPKMRILEELFLDDDLGHTGAQEFFLHRELDTERPFFLGCPRLIANSGCFVRTPFASDPARQLCGARRSSVDLLDLAKKLALPSEALSPYFTNSRQNDGTHYRGDDVRVRYFGHASVLVETKETNVLIDPTYAHDKLPNAKHFKYTDLPPRIDTVFISHGHQDHFCPETLLQLRDRIGLVVIPPNNHGELSDPSLKRMLLRLGFERICILDPLESVEIPNGRITALPFSGEHADLDIHSKHCALVEVNNRRICFFIDSDAIDPEIYRRIRGRLLYPDLMFVGMECCGAPLTWLYGPLLSTAVSNKIDNSRRLSGANAERAWAVASDLHPRNVLVYAMGQEPWMRHLMGLSYTDDSIQLQEAAAFVRQCCEAGISAEHLHMTREFII